MSQTRIPGFANNVCLAGGILNLPDGHKTGISLRCGELRQPDASFIPRRSQMTERAQGQRNRTLLEDWPLVLVTGANGYIGSHVVLELLKEGRFGVVAIDSLVNSSPESLRRVRLLAAQPALRCPPTYFHQVDIRDQAGVEAVFRRYRASDGRSRIYHVIHFAALKSVERSQLDPRGYYSTNVGGTAGLLDAMAISGVRSLVFSSSAVVYGARAGSEGEAPGELLVETACPVRADQPEAERIANYERVTNPYGKTKLMCEEIIHAHCRASNYGLRAVILRYTNPSGNDASGLIGDSPVEAENLMPIAAQVLQGKREQISIYGADYRTRDGTGVRDFIHVQDLSRGHLAALNAFKSDQDSQEPYPNNCRTYNLGTGKGASVMEVIKSLMNVSGRVIKTVIAPRRAGDLAVVVCDPSKAERELGWRAEKSVLEMANDLWTFCLKNPNGLSSSARSWNEIQHGKKKFKKPVPAEIFHLPPALRNQHSGPMTAIKFKQINNTVGEDKEHVCH